jgi:hypothetical protein
MDEYTKITGEIRKETDRKAEKCQKHRLMQEDFLKDTPLTVGWNNEGSILKMPDLKTDKFTELQKEGIEQLKRLEQEAEEQK